ncbi:MAG: Htaa protein [Microbacteriaceae bacterium]|nr:Htaa protein [Microbacteriaceae bacterium]
MSGSISPHLAWNVKTSFRSYVDGAGGVIEATGAARSEPNSFLFPYVGEEAGVLRFEGAVRFTAHGGAMNLLVENPWLHVEDGSTRLSVAGTEATRTAGGRLFLAQLDATAPATDGDELSWVAVPATLLAEGAVAFDFNYAAGTQLDPVTYSVPARP